MNAQWDETYDVVVGGTGVAALTAAVTAADAGMTVIMLESTDRWGGSSAMSGGGLWLPNNPLMGRDGVSDSRDEALTYLEATVGDAGSATSRARKEAFVDGIAGFVDMAERLGVRFARATDYPDYYPERPGGKIGRAIEVEPFDVHAIGEWWVTSRGLDGVPVPMKTDDFWLLSRAWSTPGGMARGAKVLARVLGRLVRRQKAVGMGGAVTASLLQVALALGVDVRLSSPISELLTEDGGVSGVRTTRNGAIRTIAAARGVILGGGGFDHNVEWRERYQGVTGADSSGSRGNVGSAIEVAMKIDAAVDLMDEAWWGGSVPSPTPDGSAMFLVSERSMPHSIIVDAGGHRFVNESESYVDLGHQMFEHFKHVPGTCWMITDVRHTHRYLRSYAMDPRAVKAMEAAGILVKAPTLAALAGRIRVDVAALAATVDRFNGFCRAGIDSDFARGSSAYDRYYGDPLVRPNPNLGTIEKGPFVAVQVVPGDLGTSGGLVSDEYARVLREDGSVIEGLYVCGNNSASVMGRTYPGPGSTLGPAAVFGYIAAKHIASS